MSSGDTGNSNIPLTAKSDDIALENDDRFNLKFVHAFGPEIFYVLDNEGEYLRDTAVVEIMDDDCEYIIINLLLFATEHFPLRCDALPLQFWR